MATTDVQTVNIDVNQGDCFNNLLSFFESNGTTPKDVSAWTFTSQIREEYDSEIVLATFSFSQAGYDTNQTLMSLTAAQTLSLPEKPSVQPGNKVINRLSYDLKAEIDGCIYTIQQGTVFVNPTVTR